MKKLIFGLLALLVLSACKKSGSVDIVINDDVRSMSMSEFRPLDETAKEEEKASYDVFSVVPGTYKIEYYQDEFTNIAYNVKLTLKLHLNHSLRLTETFYEHCSKSDFRGDDIHSLPLGEIWEKTSRGKIDFWVEALDANGKKTHTYFQYLIPAYCDNSQKDALKSDAWQEVFEFVTSPAGTEKEITFYTSGTKDFPNEAKDITSIYIYTRFDRCLEKDKDYKYAYWVYKN